jgi:hypothetical protein
MSTNDLDTFALKYGTDKSSAHHNYTQVYDAYFQERRESVVGLLEIGVGGKTYNGPAGGSLMMWRDYFPSAKVIGLDNDPTVDQDYGERIGIVIGDQTSARALDVASGRAQELSIVIDDGSHKDALSIATFEYLFPKLAPGGVYVIEDTQCFYTVPVFENSRYLYDCFLLRLIHSIEQNGRIVTPKNSADFRKIDDFVLNVYERWVDRIAIHRGLLFIFKRDS